MSLSNTRKKEEEINKMKNEIQNLINIINEKEKTHQNKIKEVELYQEQIQNLQNKFKQREM